MKIALVTPYQYPYPGGVTEHISALDREFRARGHDTRILAPSTEDQLEGNVIKVSGAINPVPFAGSMARISLSPQVYRRVKRILNQEQFDIIHVHEPAVPVLCLAVLRHSHSINVGTFHAYRNTSAIYEYGKPLASRIYGRLQGRIFVSDAVRDYINHYFPGKHVIIPNGIDLVHFADPKVTAIERFTDGRPNILFVGRLEARKGFRFLLEAFAHVKQVMPEARLLVAGAYHKEEKATFVHQVRQANVHGVHFVGWLTREQLIRYYHTATVFCAPATGFESFGIVLLEAMASGVPVVASDIPGYRSVMQDSEAGLLVPPGDPAALASALLGLLRDPVRRVAMAAAGRQHARGFDWPLIADRVLAYYDELISQYGTRAGGRQVMGKAGAGQ